MKTYQDNQGNIIKAKTYIEAIQKTLDYQGISLEEQDEDTQTPTIIEQNLQIIEKCLDNIETIGQEQHLTNQIQKIIYIIRKEWGITERWSG